MNQEQALNLEIQSEQYQENHNIYGMFQELIEGLVINKPKDPINYLINKLSQPEVYCYFFIAPPGSNAGETLREICEENNGSFQNYGKAVKREIEENSEIGKAMSAKFLQKRIYNGEKSWELFFESFKACAKNGRDIWVEGYPKTKIQAQKIRELKILPDVIMILNKDVESCMETLIKDFVAGGDNVKTATSKAQESIDEYYHMVKEVKSIYPASIFESDQNDQHIKRKLLRINRVTSYPTAPKRSPRILIVGPPGSGRSTITSIVSEKYNFTPLFVSQLLGQYSGDHNELSGTINQGINSGNLVDTNIVNEVVGKRLKKKDVQMLGFVLQGYPKTIEQFQYFEETLEITPSHIFMLQSDFNFINERVGNRMIDNHTLIVYLSSEVKDLDEDIKKRLQPVLQESEESLRKRFELWESVEAHLKEKYEEILYPIDANQPRENIVESISFVLEKHK